MKKNITIKDIAEISGVAKSTVSRYLNGGSVKKSTGEKIQKIIDEYDYQPSAFAKSLKADKTNLIGVILPCFDSITSSKTLMSIDKTLKNNGYETLVFNTNHSDEKEKEYIDKLINLKVDGIILFATNNSSEIREKIKKCNIPLIVIGQEIDDITSIFYDDYLAGAYIAQQVKREKIKNIAYLGVYESDRSVGINRKQGFIENIDQKIEVITQDFSLEQAYENVKKLLKNQKIDLIVCATDKLAFGAYKAISELGLIIGKDIKVIGFGGYGANDFLIPSLYSVKFDYEYAGVKCANTIIDMTNNKKVNLKQIIGFELIEGDSF